MRIRRALPLAVLLLTPALAGAEVKLEVRDDGTTVMRNEPPAARQRRLSTRAVAPTPLVAGWIARYADERDVDPQLVQAVMQAESGYNPKALSNKGAIGLMQLMPGTAKEVAVDDPWDPEQNVRGGVTYLKRMLDLFAGDLEFALAAYNAGPNAVLENAGVPPYADTREYVRRVLCLYQGECAGEAPVGRKVQITRDAENRIVLTTSGPGG